MSGILLITTQIIGDVMSVLSSIDCIVISVMSMLCMGV